MALCLMYVCTSYGWYFNIIYLPAYLEEQHGVRPNDTLGSLFKGGPLILGAAGCLLGGWRTDFILAAPATASGADGCSASSVKACACRVTCTA